MIDVLYTEDATLRDPCFFTAYDQFLNQFFISIRNQYQGETMTLFKSRNIISPVIFVMLFGLSACGGSDDKVVEDPPPGDPPPGDPPPSAQPPADSFSSIELDATAGGFGAQPDDPVNKYTYFNLDSGQTVALTDTEADSSLDWHIAFKRTKVKLNGGSSGPGNVEGTVADSQDDFYQANGTVNNSVFLNATAEGELPAFQQVASSAGLIFEEDSNTPAIKGDGSSDGWWLYNSQNHSITANNDAWWLIKSAKGDSYAKTHVTGIEQANKQITLEMFVQGKDDSVFSTTPVSWTADIGAAGGSKCYDFDDAAQVDCTGIGAGSWDIMVEISGFDWNIWSNSTVHGFGNGKAFGKIENADIGNYVSATMTSTGTDIVDHYAADGSGAFLHNTWYAYGLQGNHKLWPNYRVYAIDTGTAKYKLQLVSFYNSGGVSGHITLRYETLPVGG